MRQPIPNIKYYWLTYGGLKSFIKSKYLIVSILTTIILYGLNIRDYVIISDYSIYLNTFFMLFTIISYIGVSLTMFNQKFSTIINYAEYESYSTFEKINSSFVHILFINIISIVNTIFFYLLSERYGYLYEGYHMFSYAIFTYSVTLVFATIMNIISISKWFALNMVSKTYYYFN